LFRESKKNQKLAEGNGTASKKKREKERIKEMRMTFS
jgi:hypothetical protein